MCICVCSVKYMMMMIFQAAPWKWPLWWEGKKWREGEILTHSLFSGIQLFLQLRKTSKEEKGRGLVTFIYVIVEWEIQDIGRAVQLKAHVRKAEYCTVKMFYFLPTSAGWKWESGKNSSKSSDRKESEWEKGRWESYRRKVPLLLFHFSKRRKNVWEPRKSSGLFVQVSFLLFMI